MVGRDSPRSPRSESSRARNVGRADPRLATAAIAEGARHRKELEQLRDQLRRTQQAKDRVDGRLAETSAEVKKLRKEVDKRGQEVNSARYALDHEHRERAELDRQVEASKACIRKLESRLAKLQGRHELDMENDRLGGEVEVLRQAKLAAEATADALHEEREHLRHEVANLKHALRARASDLGVASDFREGVLYDLGEARAKMEELQDELKSSESSRLRLESENRRLGEVMADLQSARDRQTHQVDEVASALAEMRRRKEDLASEVRSMMVERDAAEAAMREYMSAAEARSTEASEELLKSDKAAREWKDEAMRKSREAAEVQADLEARLQRYLERNQELQKLSDMLQDQVEKGKRRWTTESQARLAASSEAAEARHAATELDEQRQNLRDAAQRAEAQVAAAEDRERGLQDKFAELERGHSSALDRIDLLEREREALSKTVDAGKTREKALERRCEELEAKQKVAEDSAHSTPAWRRSELHSIADHLRGKEIHESRLSYRYVDGMGY
mmetsp:Transcript_47566/g.107921  ORF Transcript_47566/g.107921 Transcript_47566/m.107921 type:complete len:508 (-) Transcript_47566:102-1625(-)